jgi:antitoxin VapB
LSSSTVELEDRRVGTYIKNEESHRLIRELAAMAGETQTAAVTEAVRERLARLQRQRDRDAVVARLLAIGRSAAPHLSDPGDDPDPAAFLYDEDGLPT